MQYSPAAQAPMNRVRAVFQTSAAFFDMPRAATFEQLADRLCSLGEHHAGPLSRIDVDAHCPSESGKIREALLDQLTTMEDGSATVVIR